MTLNRLLSIVMAVPFLQTPAHAEHSGFFAGLDMSGGMAFGSSSTTKGGAAFAGGGVVNHVKFGGAIGGGGHAGYRFDPSLSTFISYRHIRSDVGWNANFPVFNISSDFKGTAISNAVMGHLAYDLALSDATSVRTSAGLGLSFNSLSGVVETDKGTGTFLADVADHTQISPTAQIGAGISHRIAPRAVLGVDASISYTGGFATGHTRSGNLGITPITPYKIDSVWRADLGASLRYEF